MKFAKLRALTGVLVLLSLSTPTRAEDELISLDDVPSTQAAKPGARTAPDGELTELESQESTGEEEVALDLGAEDANADFFNPYVFSRNPIWILLPMFGLIILALHLLPVPKRQAKKKIDQAQRFFRGLSGESTGMINVKELRESTRTSIQRPKKENK